MSSTTTTAPSSHTKAARVSVAIASMGAQGATVDELVATLGIGRKSVAGRVAEMVKRGQLRTAGTRTNRRGMQTTIYVWTHVIPQTPSKAPKPKRKSRAKNPKKTITHEQQHVSIPAVPTFSPPPAKKLKNHFILVSDHSGSMAVHRYGAAALFNKQLDTIIAAADQENTVTVFQFGLEADGPGSIKEKRFNVPPTMVERFTGATYEATGNTPLYDAVIQAGQRALCDGDTEKSFVMFVVTDGEENRSRADAVQLRDFITRQQATDRWTFVFLVPKGYKQKFVTLAGVHEANVQEWDTTQDISKVESVATGGTVGYFAARRMGSTASRNFFQTNLGNVTTTDLTKLRDITHEIKSWAVDKENDILTFVNYKTGGRFAPGKAFYELTKKEKQVQDYKRVLLYDRQTGRFYADNTAAGATVRGLLGLPSSGDVAIEPGDHRMFSILIQSTSTNRRLVRGSRVAFWENPN